MARPAVLVPIILALGCRGPNEVTAPDAEAQDAPTPPGPLDEDVCFVLQHASCLAGLSTTDVAFDPNNGMHSHRVCTAPDLHYSAQCAAGCAVDLDATVNLFPMDIAGFASHPSVLCAETPEAKVGDACQPLSFPTSSATATASVENAIPCLPTRALVNPDGTVAGQNYLACVGMTCAATTPPIVPSYLQTCITAIQIQYGSMPGILGAVDYNGVTCLIAWDAVAQELTSGLTIRCIGDWNCPAGSLCDDQIPFLTSTAGSGGVCKPGPAGTLTSAMLSHWQ